MGKVTVDFSDVKDFEALPKGEYECVISEAKMVWPDSEDKYPYVQLTLKVTDAGDFNDRMLWARWSHSPKALFRMRNDLANLGFPVDEIDFEYDEDSDLITSPELVGLPVVATVTQREYQGNMQNDVQVLRAADSAKIGQKTTGRKAPATAAKKRSFK